MRTLKYLSMLAVACLLSACGGRSSLQPIPSAPQQVRPPETIQPTATNIAAFEPDVTGKFKCTSSYGPFTFSAGVSGTTPANIQHGSAVKMTGFQVSVTVPASIVNRLISLGIHSVTMNTSLVDINATDASPKTVNAANPPISYGPVALHQNKPAIFLLPASPITIGPWTAKTVGTMLFKTGNVTVVVSDSSFSLTLTCKPGPAVTISKTTVS